ncbi:MAG: hypothetical protein WCL14_14710 [Bacteroidota bacterium]
MDIFEQIVDNLSKDELRHLKFYLNRTNWIEDRKDIKIIDLMRKPGKKLSQDEIHEKLFEGMDKNNFYRLRSRMIDEVQRAMTLQYFEKDDTNYILYHIASSKLYFTRNKFKLSEFFLKKAETKASKLGLHDLLDIIYSDFIKLSHEMVSINPEIYIEKRKQNETQLKQIRQIDDILAVVSYRLKVNQNFSSTENPVVTLLQKTLDDFSMDKDIINSPSLRFKIYQAVSQVLLQRKEYKSLEEYLLNAYNQCLKEKLFNKSNHNNKLQMLTYIVNSLFANNKLEASLEYAEQLKQGLEEYNRLLYDKYVFFYYNALVLNYAVTDLDKGIELLEDLQSNESLRNTPFYEVFVYLNLGIFWFKKKDYHKSVKQFNKLFQHESYKNADETLQFKIAIAELIIRYEVNDFDFLDYRIAQIRKDFRELFRSADNEREREFVLILREMVDEDNIQKNPKLLAKINDFINSDQLEWKEDAEVINYSNWLKGKIA